MTADTECLSSLQTEKSTVAAQRDAGMK